MRKAFLIIILLLIINNVGVNAQRIEPKYNLSTSLGYGTENNFGNTAFYVGLAINKFLINRFKLEAGLTYFTTDIYNVYKAKPVFYANEDRKYNSLFFNLNLQYVIGNENSLINTKIKVGPSLKYYDYKILKRALVYNMPQDDLYPIVPGTEVYYEKNGVNIALYNGVSFDAKVNQNLRVGVFLDVYSGIIPIEHFMPGINATFKLNGKIK